MIRKPILAIGLEGIVAVETSLSRIDGENGKIMYRHVETEQIREKRSFEEVAFLLWYGSFPCKEQLESFKSILAAQRTLPQHVKQTIDQIPINVDMMSVLQTTVSALNEVEYNWPPTLEQATRLLPKIPTIIAYRKARLDNRKPIEPRDDLDHTANYLYMLFGHEPSPTIKRILETYLILTQELGSNPSTFAARVVASTRSDLISSLSAAIGALKGPLHGGAPAEVLAMLISIGTKENAEPWMRRALERAERLMGFGHRLFKAKDPRSNMLKEAAFQLGKEHDLVDLAIHVEQTAIRLLKEYKPGKRLITNVDYYAAVIMSVVGLDASLFTPTFALSRTVGWCAHIVEQAANNRLIYPQSKYIGGESSIMPEQSPYVRARREPLTEVLA